MEQQPTTSNKNKTKKIRSYPEPDRYNMVLDKSGSFYQVRLNQHVQHPPDVISQDGFVYTKLPIQNAKYPDQPHKTYVRYVRDVPEPAPQSLSTMLPLTNILQNIVPARNVTAKKRPRILIIQTNTPVVQEPSLSVKTSQPSEQYTDIPAQNSETLGQEENETLLQKTEDNATVHEETKPEEKHEQLQTIKPSEPISVPKIPKPSSSQTNKPIVLDDILPKEEENTNTHQRKKEKISYDLHATETKYANLYPDLNDPNFAFHIAKRKEFNDTQYDGTIHPIEQQANKMCSAQFELLPHQIFVKNFLSLQTPYNSLLLYHGLGSGKTCSAIGIAEEMRAYMKQVGITRREILIVAAPNVQSNFKYQLFDERNLVEKDGYWTIDSCIGDALLREVNPTNLKGIPRQKIISQIKALINSSYRFLGYSKLANLVAKKTAVPENTGLKPEDLRQMEIKKIRNVFDNRLIIIDEVHNIRLTNDNKDWKTAKALTKLAKYCNNLRLLMLSATPMYNSYKEIIWLVNLMNMNDKRAEIANDEVFDKHGKFKEAQKGPDGTILVEGGKELLHRKMIGYVSYVRGENPYTFPYRIYPDTFSKENTFYEPTSVISSLSNAVSVLTGSEKGQIVTAQPKQPKTQLNGKPLGTPLEHLPVYTTQIGEYQEKAYRLVIDGIKKDIEQREANASVTGANTFEEMDRFGFRRLQTPLEALNMVYPSENLDNCIAKGDLMDLEKEDDVLDEDVNDAGADVTEFDEETDAEDLRDPRAKMVGMRGLRTVMSYIGDNPKIKVPVKHGFQYKTTALAKYGRIFSPDILPKYSAKISKICETIRKSKGIVMIYSQYIDGGVVPLSLALEEMGFTRFGTSNLTKPLFATPPTEPMDATTMQSRSSLTTAGKKFTGQAKYVMITGDTSFSPQNAEDMKVVTSKENANGELVKVIIISKAGSEGLDFKNVRQIHILEPWYNLNRIEQIVGRAVRNLSHCALPFKQRNVEVYMHSTVLRETPEEEAADVYVYRLAKNKANLIGQVTRVIKETAVDCNLNIGQTNFTVAKMATLAENQNIEIELSTDAKKIVYQIGDRPHTDLCDYMDTCELKCMTPAGNNPILPSEVVQDTYSLNYLQSNNVRLMQRIRQLFKDQHFYKRSSLIEAINIVKLYPIQQIYSALTVFVKNKNEYLIDKYGRRGNLMNKGDVYAFQPIEINDNAITVFEREVPVEYKRSAVELDYPKEFPENTSQTATDAGTTPYGKMDTNEAYKTIMETFKQNVTLATTHVKSGTSSDNWYINVALNMDHLQTLYDIKFDMIVDHIIRHMVDMLMPRDKMVLVSYYYSKVRAMDKLDEIEQVVKSYLDTKMVKMGTDEDTDVKAKIGFLIADKTTWKIYIQSDEDNTTWVEAEPEDVRLFKKYSSTQNFEIDPELYPKFIGFINMFKDGKQMVLRIKDLSQTHKGNKGTNLNQQIKRDLLKWLNILIGQTRYTNENSKMITMNGFRVIIEILLREWTRTEKDGKVWILDPEKAMFNHISEFHT
jgi:hypothetical protein